MTVAEVRSDQDALHGGTDFQDSRFRVVERVLQAFAVVEVAPQAMVDYQLEVVRR